jgi:uncharacterized membrane protein (DUF2068 family)
MSATTTQSVPPGAKEKTQPFMPPFHWELLVCGTLGHRLEGRDAFYLRDSDRVFAIDRGNHRWHRCLRCDSWLPLDTPANPRREHPPERQNIILPLRGKPLRDKIVLRAIAVNRALHWFFLSLIGVVILVFSANRADMRDITMKLIADLSGGTTASSVPNHGFLHEVTMLFSLQTHRLHVFAFIALIYGTVEGLEAVGLWFCKRWAEYLTFLVTASLLPLEVYELSHHVSPFKITAFIINIAVVGYLLYAKRLFGLRGGGKADEALKAHDVGWPALERTLPANL